MARDNDHDNESLIDQFYDKVTRLRHEPESDPETLLDQSLQLIVDLAGARLAYIELRSSTTNARFVRGQGCNDDDLETIRRTLSSTIVEHVFLTNELLILDSAIDDTRFAELGSVKQNEIRQVIVFPVGATPTCGVIYVQGQPGRSVKPTIQTRIATFARLLSPLADRLLGESRSLVDETRAFQQGRILEALQRHRWNYEDAADDLQIARSHIYRRARQLGIKKPDV